MNRSQRRAAFHKTSAQTPTQSTISEAQLAANRANAQHSHGPTSEAGKAKVSQNAVKTGLTGRTVIVPFGEADAYQSLILDFQKQFQPVGPQETALVQSLTDIAWRLDRIPGLEYALLELGRVDLIKQSPELANNPTEMLEMQIRLHFEKQFRNLQLQENRLSRRRERETKELRALQQARQEAAEAQTKEAPKPAADSNPVNVSSENGFVFSTPAQPEPSTEQAVESERIHEAAAA